MSSHFVTSTIWLSVHHSTAKIWLSVHLSPQPRSASQHIFVYPTLRPKKWTRRLGMHHFSSFPCLLSSFHFAVPCNHSQSMSHPFCLSLSSSSNLVHLTVSPLQPALQSGKQGSYRHLEESQVPSQECHWSRLAAQEKENNFIIQGTLPLKGAIDKHNLHCTESCHTCWCPGSISRK